ncbi:MAG: hypothetical protein K940chlam9_00195 [Chlamydiae bacterium]|nr:hypothetical protein [Chlamydiota bacterium]
MRKKYQGSRFRLWALSLLFLFLLYPVIASAFSLTPPKGWERIDDPEQLPQKVSLIYIGAGKGQFTPSLNVATEKTSLPLQEYISLAKSYHESQPDTRCTSLGKIQAKCGQMELIQIDSPSQWGRVRFLQAICIHEEIAYVVTATSLQEEFASLVPLFHKSFQTFSLE